MDFKQSHKTQTQRRFHPLFFARSFTLLVPRHLNQDAVTSHLRSSYPLNYIRVSIQMIGVFNILSFIAFMPQKLTLSHISDESKDYLERAEITTAGLRI